MTQTATGELRAFGRRVRFHGAVEAGATVEATVDGGRRVFVQVESGKRADGHWWGAVANAPRMSGMTREEREEYEAARGNPGGLA